MVYLAIFDPCFSSSHVLDHAYINFPRKIPDFNLCLFLAFVVKSSILGQWLTVLFTAVSASMLTVFQIKLDLGRFDWKLLLSVDGIPTTFCLVGLVCGTSRILSKLLKNAQVYI